MKLLSFIILLATTFVILFRCHYCPFLCVLCTNLHFTLFHRSYLLLLSFLYTLFQTVWKCICSSRGLSETASLSLRDRGIHSTFLRLYLWVYVEYVVVASYSFFDAVFFDIQRVLKGRWNYSLFTLPHAVTLQRDVNWASILLAKKELLLTCKFILCMYHIYCHFF